MNCSGYGRHEVPLCVLFRSWLVSVCEGLSVSRSLLHWAKILRNASHCFHLGLDGHNDERPMCQIAQLPEMSTCPVPNILRRSILDFVAPASEDGCIYELTVASSNQVAVA